MPSSRHARTAQKLYELFKTDKNAQFSSLPNETRKRFRDKLVELASRQDSLNRSFPLTAQGTIADPTLLNVREDGRVTAPHDLVTEYPEEDHHLVINDITFSILPEDISIDTETYTKKDWSLRTKGMIKNKSGQGTTAIWLRLPFVGATEINTNLRRLMAQIRTIPIAYIDNQLIRQMVYPDDRNRNMAVAITGATLMPHPESPEVIYCTLTMEIFNYRPFSNNFFYAGLPKGMASAPAKQTTDKLKLNNGKSPRYTTKKPSLESVLGNRAVKKPEDSLSFVQYYNTLLGNIGDTSKEAQKTLEVMSQGIRRLYDFTPVPEEGYNADVSFTYWVYTTLPFNSSYSQYTQSNSQKNQTRGGVPEYKATRPAGPITVDPSLATTKKIDAEVLVRTVKRYLGVPYGFGHDRNDPRKVDCSSLMYQVMLRSNVGNIGTSTIEQITTLRKAHQDGLHAWLKLTLGGKKVLLPLPLEIAGSADLKSGYGPCYFAMQIPGVVGYNWGSRKGVYRVVHVGMGVGQGKRIDAYNDKHGVISYNVKDFRNGTRVSQTHVLQRCYFMPGVVYDYDKHKEAFDALLSSIAGQTGASRPVKAASRSLTDVLLGAQKATQLKADLKKAHHRYLLNPYPKREVNKEKFGVQDLKRQRHTAETTLKRTVASIKRAQKSFVNRARGYERILDKRNAAPSTLSQTLRHALIEQSLEMARRAKLALKNWVTTVEEFIKKGKGFGWELVWMHNGTAILRRPVTLNISAGRLIKVGEHESKAIPVQAGIGVNNIFARIPMIGQHFVTHQYLGSSDAEGNLAIQCTGTAPVAMLTAMQKYNETVTRLLRQIPSVGVVRIKHHLFNLTGAHEFIIDNMNVKTVQGSPGLYQVIIRLTEWSKHAQDKETMQQEYALRLDHKQLVFQRLFDKLQKEAAPQVTLRHQKFSGDRLSAAPQVTIKGKNLPVLPNDDFARIDEVRPQPTDIQAIYLEMLSLISAYWTELVNSNILGFLGWTREEFLRAAKDPKHPFYTFHAFEIGANDKYWNSTYRFSAVQSSTGFFNKSNRSSPSVRFVTTKTMLQGLFYNPTIGNGQPILGADEIIQKVAKIANSKDGLLSRMTVGAARALTLGQLFQGPTGVQRQALNGIDQNLQKYALGFGAPGFPRAKKIDPRLLGRYQATKKFLATFARKETYVPDTLLGRDSSVLTTTKNLANGVRKYGGFLIDYIVGEYWRGTATRKVIDAILGPNAKKIRDSYPDIAVTIATNTGRGSRGNDTKRRSYTSTTLRKGIHEQQIRVATALYMFFKNMRNAIAARLNGQVSRLLRHPDFRDILAKIGAEDHAFSGLPAYNDIPLPRPVVLDVHGKETGERIWLNPDFFWYNPDDMAVANLERLYKYEYRAAQVFRASVGFSRQFGMYPAKGNASKKVDKKAKWASNLPDPIPGPYATMFMGGPHRKQFEGIIKTQNNLPDSIFMSMFGHDLNYGVTNGKFGSMNVGISDSGVAQNTPLEHIGTPKSRDKLPLYQKTHPQHLQRVQFGGAGLSEVRTPVMLDRRPESVFAQYRRSLETFKRNTFKMRRAFPAFKLYFIEDDTGGTLGGDKTSLMRSYDDFFSLASVKDIKKVKSRKLPADLLIIRLSNLHGYLDTVEFSTTRTGKKDPLAPRNSETMRETLDQLKLDTTDENPFVRFILKEGVRVQFAMGNENDPRYLEREFNGQIVQINNVNADEIVIVCQSFGTQLVAKKKGIARNSVQSEWVDTFQLLSWAMCQPEVSYFGRWGLDASRSIGESRSTGGWEKVFSFLADPRDDNIYAPSRNEMLTYYADFDGGIWSYLWSEWITNPLVTSPIAGLIGGAGTLGALGLTGVGTLGLGFVGAGVGAAVGLGGAYAVKGASALHRVIKRRLKSSSVKGLGSVTWMKKVGDMDLYKVDVKVPVYTPGKGYGTATNYVTTAVKESGNAITLFGNYKRGNSKLLDYQVFRQTIWDIFKEMELRHPGWIGHPVPYGNRMTMFFGLPTQLYWSRPMTTQEKLASARQNHALIKHINGNKDLQSVMKLSAKIQKKGRTFGHLRRAVYNKVVDNAGDIIFYGSIALFAISALTGGIGALAGGAGLRASLAMGLRAGIGNTLGFATRGALGAGALVSNSARLLTASGFVTTGRTAVAAALTQGLAAGGLAAKFARAAQLGLSAARIARGAGLATLGVTNIGGGVLGLDFLKLNSVANALYASSILTKAQQDYFQKNLLKAISGRLVPFRRYHMITSENHIVANTIKASVHGTYNAMTLEYTAEVDGNVEKPGATSTKVAKASDRILDKDTRMGLATFRNCRGSWMANRYLQGLLMRYLKDTYKGSILILGDDSIRPYDRVFIADAYSDMYGVIEVEQVVTTLSPETGALTEITPDLVVHGNNIVDLPFDDYMTAKMAWDRISWSQSLEAAVRFQGSQYQKLLTQGSGAGDPRKATNKNDLQRKVDGQFAGNLYNYAKDSGSYTFNRLLFGSMAVKFFEWSSMRQPVVYQPLFIGSRPLLAGVPLDRVNIVQHFRDRFVPVISKIYRGFNLLNQAADSMMSVNMNSYLSHLTPDDTLTFNTRQGSKK